MRRYDRYLSIIRIIVVLAALALGIYVALSPGIVYAPVPRVILFLLVSLLPAVLFGAEAASRFELKIPGFVFATAGAAAVSLGILVTLHHLSKPQQQIAVFHILDEEGQPVTNLDRQGAVQVPLTNEGISITPFVDGNTIVLIFPEQVGECEIRVRPISMGKTYSGKVSYSGNRESALRLGTHLRSN